MLEANSNLRKSLQKSCDDNEFQDPIIAITALESIELLIEDCKEEDFNGKLNDL